MKTKFKIGDTIHFMNDNKPKTEKITGISMYDGDINDLHFTNKKEDKTKILYHYSNYCSVNENDVFNSIEELKDNLFNPNEEK